MDHKVLGKEVERKPLLLSVERPDALLLKQDLKCGVIGLQTRSFCYIDDCVEGVLRLFHSEFREPLNIGSDEMVSMVDMGKIALEFAGKTDTVKIRHIPGPEGVRGRNSDNTLIKEVLGWAPGISLKEGLGRTFKWIDGQLAKEEAAGIDVTAAYASSKVVQNTTPEDAVNESYRK